MGPNQQEEELTPGSCPASPVPPHNSLPFPAPATAQGLCGVTGFLSVQINWLKSKSVHVSLCSTWLNLKNTQISHKLTSLGKGGGMSKALVWKAVLSWWGHAMSWSCRTMNLTSLHNVSECSQFNSVTLFPSPMSHPLMPNNCYLKALFSEIIPQSVSVPTQRKGIKGLCIYIYIYMYVFVPKARGNDNYVMWQNC